MLRPAMPEDIPFVQALWDAPRNAACLTPPEPGQIDAGVDEGTLLIWQGADGPAGFALVINWLEGVWSLWAIALATPGQGQGRAFLGAVLDHVFHDRGAHRLGLDAAIDNHAALSLFRAIGFVDEGVWRECWRRPDGNWVDCAFLAVLAHEWRAKP